GRGRPQRRLQPRGAGQRLDLEVAEPRIHGGGRSPESPERQEICEELERVAVVEEHEIAPPDPGIAVNGGTTLPLAAGHRRVPAAAGEGRAPLARGARRGPRAPAVATAPRALPRRDALSVGVCSRSWSSGRPR